MVFVVSSINPLEYNSIDLTFVTHEVNLQNNITRWAFAPNKPNVPVTGTKQDCAGQRSGCHL